MGVVHSVVSVQEHWSVYKEGASNFAKAVQRISARAEGGLPEGVVHAVSENIVARAEDLLSAVVKFVFSNVHRFVLEFVMMALYIIFWLADPMPVGSNIEELFRRYIILKSVACLGYGVCVGVL